MSATRSRCAAASRISRAMNAGPSGFLVDGERHSCERRGEDEGVDLDLPVVVPAALTEGRNGGLPRAIAVCGVQPEADVADRGRPFGEAQLAGPRVHLPPIRAANLGDPGADHYYFSPAHVSLLRPRLCEPVTIRPRRPPTQLALDGISFR